MNPVDVDPGNGGGVAEGKSLFNTGDSPLFQAGVIVVDDLDTDFLGALSPYIDHAAGLKTGFARDPMN
jgi:hypothetical protein